MSFERDAGLIANEAAAALGLSAPTDVQRVELRVGLYRLSWGNLAADAAMTPAPALLVRGASLEAEAAGAGVWREYLILRALRSAGALVPDPVCYLEELSESRWVYGVYEAVPGDSLESSPTEIAWVEQLGVQLARVHVINPYFPGLESLDAPTWDLVGPRISRLREALDDLPGSCPAFEWVGRHLERVAPRDEPAALCHCRLDETCLAVHRGQLFGIEDWMGADWGDPYQDLAAVKRFLVGSTDGDEQLFCSFLEGYARERGEGIDLARIEFWILLLELETRVKVAGEMVGAGQTNGRHGARDLVSSQLEIFAKVDRQWRQVDVELIRCEAGVRDRLLSQLRELYGEHRVAAWGAQTEGVETAALRRLARDVRDGMLDGAVALGARAIIRDYLHGLLKVWQAGVAKDGNST